MKIKVGSFYQNKETKEKIQVISVKGSFVEMRYESGLVVNVANTRFIKIYEEIGNGKF